MRRAFRWIIAALLALGLVSTHWAIAGYRFETDAPQTQGDVSVHDLSEHDL